MEGLEMDFLHHCGAFCASIAILWCVAAHADQHANLASPEDRYDLRRLMQPSAAELASEEKGRVHIYDSLEINEAINIYSIKRNAALIVKDCITHVELIEYPELGMEAIYMITVKDFPAFIIVDDKGNDFFEKLLT